jgi:hypothetical protein
MKIVKRFCAERLPDVVIATRCQVDVLAIPGLLFVESFSQKKLNCTAEVLLQRAVLLGGYHRCIDRLWKVVMQPLPPGRFVLAFESIFELFEGVRPVEVNFFCPLIEIGDYFGDSECDASQPLLIWIPAFNLLKRGSLFLHFVPLPEEVFLAGRFLEKSQRWFLVN